MKLTRLVFRLLLRRRLPTIDGTISTAGVRGEVRIRRDSFGIPHIEAQNDVDAWYALGFCQGQDRAFQLETLLRVARGTLSEIVGADALPVDLLSRRMGLRSAAEQQVASLDDDVLAALDAFVKGVNEGSTLGARRRAHEFSLLRASPTRYEVADALGAIKLISLALASNWDVELARLKILQGDGPEALHALDPSYPSLHSVSSPVGATAGPAIDRLMEDLQVFHRAAGLGGASNNWAIAASRTASGRPILANDPHLRPSLPPHWYLAHIQTAEWAVAGASFLGAPAFPVAHNGIGAWGVTAGLIDNTDLFIEEVGPDGRSVREGDLFVPCEVRREVIRVKGGATVEEEVLITPRGPLVGPSLDGELGAVSLRATWLDPRPVRGLIDAPRARSFDEFRRAFDRWPGPSLNVVYADTSGSIGWQLVGDAPRRRKGWGMVPLPGWDEGTGWEEDIVPFDDMPFDVDPAAGFVATANNQPLPSGRGPFLGVDWADGYRHGRIVEALGLRSDWDLDEVAVLQMDEVSRPWSEFRDVVLSAPGDVAETRQALGLLRGWDGIVSLDSVPATVFELFLDEMSRRVAEARAPQSARWVLGTGSTPPVTHTAYAVRRVGHLAGLLRERPAHGLKRPWPDEVADALADAIRRLRQDHGNDNGRWAWGRVRPLTLRHPAGKGPLARVFNLGPFAWGGDTNTVAQAAVDPANVTANPLYIPSLRAVFDVGRWDDCRFVLPGGQSGNPLSRHYDDMLPLWKDSKGACIAWTAEAVEEATVATLNLVPSSSNASDGTTQ